MSKNYYEILEVDKKSSPEEIKKSYRKLALKYHPDKNNGDSKSEERFKEISEAYDVLSDENKRREYDSIGSNPFGGGFGSSPFEDIFSSFNDIFGTYRGDSRRNNQRRGRNLRISVKIDIKDIIFGTKKKIRYNRDIICGTCDGSGGDDIKNCNHCNSRGFIDMVQNTPFGQVRQTITCSHCGGEGKLIINPCKDCHGRGTILNSETLDIDIPKGVFNGSMLTVPGFGNQIKNGHAGDLEVVIEEIPDPNFKRMDANLIYEQYINVLDALLGTEKTLTLPHGTDITYKISGGTQHGKVIKISGKGVATHHRPGYIGDLLIKINLVVPSEITIEERLKLEELRKSKSFC